MFMMPREDILPVLPNKLPSPLLIQSRQPLIQNFWRLALVLVGLLFPWLRAVICIQEWIFRSAWLNNSRQSWQIMAGRNECSHGVHCQTKIQVQSHWYGVLCKVSGELPCDWSWRILPLYPFTIPPSMWL